MKKISVFGIFLTLLCICLLTPLIFSLNMIDPFMSSKILFFLFFTELAFPFYLFLLLQYPEHRPRLGHPLFLSIILFFSITCLSAIFGVDPINSFFGNSIRMEGVIVLGHVLLFSLYLDLAWRIDRTWKHQILILFLMIFTFSAFVGCLQTAGIVPFFTNLYSHRVTSFTGNPIFFAGTLLIPLFLSAGYVMQHKKDKQKYAYVGVCLILLLGIIFSQTRGAMLGVILGTMTCLFTFVLLTSSQKAKKRMYWMFPIGLLVCVALFFGLRSVSSTHPQLYRMTHFRDTNTDSRLIYWNQSLRGWKDAPWLGVGQQNFYVVGQKYFQTKLYQATNGTWPDKPHNQFLEYLVSGGSIGFFAYLFLFITAGWVALKTPRERQHIHPAFILGALVAYAGQNIFSFDTIETLIPFAFLLAYSQDTHSDTHTVPKQIPLVLLCVPFILPVWSSIHFLLPTANEFFSIQTAMKNLKTEQSIDSLISAGRESFVYDPWLIAKTADDIQLNELFTKNTSTTISQAAAKEAARFYTIAIKQHPLRAQLLYDKSVSAITNAEVNKIPVPDEDLAIAQKAFDLSPLRIEALTSLAQMNELNGKKEEAIKLAKQAVQMVPDNGKALWNLARIYQENGNTKDAAPLALASFKQGVIPSSNAAIDWVIRYYSDTHDTATVVLLLENVIKAKPKNNDMLFRLAVAYAENGEKDKAIAIARKLYDRDPNSRQKIDLFIRSL